MLRTLSAIASNAEGKVFINWENDKMLRGGLKVQAGLATIRVPQREQKRWRKGK